MRLAAALAILPFLTVCLTVAQEVKTPRIENRPRIARLWNSLAPSTTTYNEHMNAASDLLHERFNPKIVVVDPDAKRRETVGHLKAAREALLSELEAVNELIEEEDY